MDLILLRHEADDLLRASAYASTTCYAIDSVYYRNTVYYVDSVELASVVAVAKSDTSEHASVRRCEPALCALAGLHALPLEHCARSVTCTVAHYVSYLWLSVSHGSSEERSYLSRYRRAAR